MCDNLTKDECLKILQDKAVGLNRLLKKSDFTDQEVTRIKAYFGPWPRALEAAGLKEPRSDDQRMKR